MLSPPTKAEILVISVQPPPEMMIFRAPLFHVIVATASSSPHDSEEGSGVASGAGVGEGSGVGGVQSGAVGLFFFCRANGRGCAKQITVAVRRRATARSTSTGGQRFQVQNKPRRKSRGGTKDFDGPIVAAGQHCWRTTPHLRPSPATEYAAMTTNRWQRDAQVCRLCVTVSPRSSADLIVLAFQKNRSFHLDLRVQIGQEGGGSGSGDVAHDVRVVEHLGDLVEQALNRLQERHTQGAQKTTHGVSGGKSIHRSKTGSFTSVTPSGGGNERGAWSPISTTPLSRVFGAPGPAETRKHYVPVQRGNGENARKSRASVPFEIHRRFLAEVIGHKQPTWVHVTGVLIQTRYVGHQSVFRHDVTHRTTCVWNCVACARGDFSYVSIYYKRAVLACKTTVTVTGPGPVPRFRSRRSPRQSGWSSPRLRP